MINHFNTCSENSSVQRQNNTSLEQGAQGETRTVLSLSENNQSKVIGYPIINTDLIGCRLESPKNKETCVISRKSSVIENLVATDSDSKISHLEAVFNINKAFCEVPTLIFCRTGDLNSLKDHYEKDPSIINCLYKSKVDDKLYPLVWIAVMNNHYQILQFLISKGADVNACDPMRQSTILHEAIRNNRLDIINILLDNKVDINAMDALLVTPLILAAYLGKLKIVEVLLNHEANICFQLDDRMSALRVATENGHQAIVRTLLRQCVDMSSRTKQWMLPFRRAEHLNMPVDNHLLQSNAGIDLLQTKERITPLHIAVEQGSMRVISSLLDRGADINARTNKGVAPLHKAVEKECMSVMNFLLDQGAEINIRTNKLMTPLHIAVERESLGMMIRLIQCGATIDAKMNKGIAPLHMAVKNGSVPMVDALLMCLANTNVVTDEMQTPLHIAIKKNDLKLSHILAKNAADINAKAQGGMTPLHLAVMHTDVSVVDFLIKYGANIEAIRELKNSTNDTVAHYTPLKDAILLQRFRIIEHLLKNNANPNRRLDGETCLHIAFKKNSSKIVELLVQYRADIYQKNPSLIFVATKNGDANVVRCLLKLNRKIAIDMKNKNGRSALHMAVIAKDINIVKVLLENNADPNIKDHDMQTPLHMASELADVSIVQLLIDKGADTNLKTALNYSCLYIATNQGNIDIIKVLIANKADIHEKNHRCGSDALIKAVVMEFIDVIEYLMQQGSDVNTSDYEGISALMYAIEIKNTQIIQLLINAGANVMDIKANIGAFHHACINESLDVVQLLINNGADVNQYTTSHSTPLHIACKKGDLDLVKLLIRNKANVNKMFKFTLSALFTAVTNKFVDVVKCLIDNDVDVNIVGEHGATCLFIAARLENSEIIRLLINNGIKVNVLDTFGFSALHLACAALDNPNVAQVLIENGANVNLINKSGVTALHTACLNGRIDNVKVLVANNADVNIMTTEQQESVLSIAVIERNYNLVEFLINNDIIVDSVNKKLNSPLFHAIGNADLHMVKILIDAGASVNKKCCIQNMTPLQYANSLGFSEICKCLDGGAAVINDGEM